MNEDYICPTCKHDLLKGVGIKSETDRIFTKNGFEAKEYTVVKKYFCPKCLNTIRRKLGEEIHKELSMKG